MNILGFVAILLSVLIVTMETKEVGDDYSIRESDQEWLNSLFYIPTSPRIRKEYRMLTDEERYQFNDAFVKMKGDRTVVPNKYDLLCSIHARRSSRNSAHRGTGFLAWHRVYTLLMENALREWYPNITMAYWDTTLDAVLELPRESSLWSEDFMGNGDGYVVTGVFKGWGTQKGELYRTVGALYGPLADKNISYLLEYDYIGNISYPLTGKDVENVFEEIHNRVHHFVGGEMKVIETAADDPVFFPYHSFISLVWEEFRTLQRLKGIDPETDWDEFYGPARHHKYSSMGIGNLMAIDGSSDLFAENIVFADRPSCSREISDCGTPHLYCNVTLEKCCPWTVKEYNIIKQAGKDNNISFSEAVSQFIESKVNKGFWQLSNLSNETMLEEYGEYDDLYSEEGDLFILMEEKYPQTDKTNNTKANADPMEDFFADLEHIFNGDNDEHLPGYNDHSHEHSHGGDDHLQYNDNDDHAHEHTRGGDDHLHYNGDDDHSHDTDEHSHDHVHAHGRVITGGKQIRYVTWMEDIATLNIVLIVLASLTGLRIILIILTKCVAENRGKKSETKKYRMDGIVNVNFDDDENKKIRRSAREKREDNIYTVTVTTSDQELSEQNGTFVRFEKYSREDVDESERPNSTERQASTVSDYIDMTYASHTGEESSGDRAVAKSSDIFEHEVADDFEEDIDESYNSIENENFGIICQAIIEADGQKSEDSFDVFDTYDNFVFKQEAALNEDETDNTKCDSHYENYLPGTHL